MKRYKSMLGVTLLEIMLVLAIAAMIIVMSIRYYQSANQNSQANTFVSQVGAITAALENYVQGTGNYSAVDSTTLTPLLPPNTLTSTPWGATLTYAAQADGYQLTASAAASAALCTLIQQKLLTDQHYTFDCTVVTYKANI